MHIAGIPSRLVLRVAKLAKSFDPVEIHRKSWRLSLRPNLKTKLRHNTGAILLILAAACFFAPSIAAASDGHEVHGHQPVPEQLYPPRVFLDKKANVVAWQLNRLENRRLLLVERSTDDPKYRPVYREILTRPGMSSKDREEALDALVMLNESDEVTELLTLISKLDGKVAGQRDTAKQLLMMLAERDRDSIGKLLTKLRTATKSKKQFERIAGYVGLVTAGHQDAVKKLAEKTPQSRLDVLLAIPYLRNVKQRAAFKELVLGSLGVTQPGDIRLAAIESLASASDDHALNFRSLAPLVSEAAFRDSSVQAMLKIPAEFRDAGISASVVKQLIKHVDATLADQRTSDAIIDATQLATELLERIPAANATAYREKLKTLSIRRIRINTIDEEMRYDVGWFAVEAGSSVQIQLRNSDAMPHNLVITTPGALREIADAGAAIGPRPSIGLPYVPPSEKVLGATGMVQAAQEDRITFTAPEQPGEYPYVCTFPGHWMRMYGVMVVVDDLDAFLKDPAEPADPTGIDREFVQAWTMDDFKADLTKELQGRSPDLGMSIFAAASCAQCHQMKGIGGSIGPELSDVLARWKGDYQGVLREILEPSHKIEEKYQMQTIETVDGLIIAGLVAGEDEKTITIVENPLSPKPTVVKKDDIEDMYTASQSMMPKSLMDRFTRDEILEMLAYITASGDK